MGFVWKYECLFDLSNFLSEHQVLSSFNSTIVINFMIKTDSLSFFPNSSPPVCSGIILADFEPWVERFQEKGTLECDSRWKWRQCRARSGTSSTLDANAALNQICNELRDKLLEVKNNTWIVADLDVDAFWRYVIFKKNAFFVLLLSHRTTAIIMINIDLPLLDSYNIKKAGTFWAFSNVGSPMDWDIYYLPRP